ncbi:MAG: CBS domain-containing protein [Candidatus Omnitrophota bacterium]
MKKLVKVQQKANTPFALKINDSIIKTSENASVREIAKILKQNKIGAIIVEKDGNLAGIISERDVVWRVVAEDKSLDETKARDIMTSDVISVDLDDGIDKIYDMMKKVPFRHLPVRKGDKVIGMVSSRDLMYLRNLKTANT